MPGGRKRVPTAIAKLHGRPGKRPLVKDEPIPPGQLIDPPSWLSEDQQEDWLFATKNAPPGVLANIDEHTLAAWCVAVDFIRQAAQTIDGKLMQRIRGGGKRVHPLLGPMQKQMLVMIRLSTEMGFTPASRPKFGTQPGGKTKGEGNVGNRTNGSIENFLHDNPDASFQH